MTTANEDVLSEEVKQEAPAPVEVAKLKQYLIMADELHMALFSKIMPGILFVQVEGMAMENNDTHMLLVNPLPKPEPVTKPLEAAQPAAE